MILNTLIIVIWIYFWFYVAHKIATNIVNTLMYDEPVKWFYIPTFFIWMIVASASIIYFLP